ncbi:hypothetical protein MINS_03930 [Mycolicibacterium insubricum]|nr:hypothetical protein MINS_03930 [Mycolicibacterium insubricum]
MCFAELVAFVTGVLGVNPTVPVPAAGTAAWCALDDADPAKAQAVLLAGLHWGLHLDLLQLARAEASREIACAAPWARWATEKHRGRGTAYIPREKVS